jgi:hypothetical protein
MNTVDCSGDCFEQQMKRENLKRIMEEYERNMMAAASFSLQLSQRQHGNVNDEQNFPRARKK